MIFRYNSRLEKYKKPFGAMANGQRVEFNIEALDGVYVEKIFIALEKDGENEILYPMEYLASKDGVSLFNCSILIEEAGLYWYYFVAETELGELNLYSLPNGELDYNSYEKFHITVYDKSFKTPEFLKGGVIYHIFIDRFNKGNDSDAIWEKNGVLKNWDEPVTIIDSDGVFRANDFYGGNFQGIIDKLDYLKELGVTLIYLSPIFKSSSNHRYDTGDYMKLDELLGTEEKFADLIKKADDMGIGIMLDGVFNHTGADSLYFNKFGNYDSYGAYQGIKSPYYDWYHFINFPEEYGCWWGITVTPTVNKKTESYRRFILGENGVIDKWSKFGIKGFRLDVVDELDIDFVYEIRKAIKRTDKENIVIGEVWEDASTKIAYSERRPYLLGKQLDGTMNYPYKDAIIDFVKNNNISKFTNEIYKIYESYPLQALNVSMNFLGTHDTVRAINSLSDVDTDNTSKQDRLYMTLDSIERKKAKERLIIAGVLQYILPGVPSIYYGDEIGMEGYEDPINRKPFTWNNIDELLLEHYKKLGEIRNNNKAIFAAKLNIYEQNGILCIERYNDKNKITAYINNNNYGIELQFNFMQLLYTNMNNIDSGVISAKSFVIMQYNE